MHGREDEEEIDIRTPGSSFLDLATLGLKQTGSTLLSGSVHLPPCPPTKTKTSSRESSLTHLMD